MGGPQDGLTRAELLSRGSRAGVSILGAAVAGRLVAPGEAGAARAASGPAPVRTFATRRDLRPPRITIRRRPAGGLEGSYFIAPSSGPGQHGPLIFDDRGEPVWFLPTPVTATAFRPQTWRGKQVLTWWEGTWSAEGLGRGVYVMLDDAYRQIARIQAGGYRDGDLHEFRITPEGTALVTKNPGIPHDLRPYGGPARGILYSGVVQEIELPSGRVLFEWDSLDHVGLDESHARANERNFDYFHVNSVDVDTDGHLLVSARNTWAVYKVHRRTGEVLWRLGGRKSDFRMGAGTITAWQHDARPLGGGRISIFDNGAAPQVQTQSRIIVVRVDTARKEARLEKAFRHRPNRIVSKYMGNGQVLPDGGVVAGWGSEPFVTEFAPNGSVRFEAQMPKGGQTYRAFRLPWKATPASPPKLVVARVGDKGGLYVSWNGATDVAAWQVRSGPSASSLEDGAVVRRSGFETYLGPRPAGAWAQAVALDAQQRPIGRSRPLRIR